VRRRRDEEGGVNAPGEHARRLVVQGRVQGVFFRVSTRREAQRLGLTGWVRNTPAGDVEVWAEGTRDALETLEAWIHAGGPPAAHVERVQASDEAPVGHERFEVTRGR
jgi:acylphosphatase